MIVKLTLSQVASLIHHNGYVYFESLDPKDGQITTFEMIVTDEGFKVESLYAHTVAWLIENGVI